MKLGERMCTRLKKELIETKYKMDVFEQGLFLGEEEARDFKERFIDSLMNYWNSLDQHGDVVVWGIKWGALCFLLWHFVYDCRFGRWWTIMRWCTCACWWINETCKRDGWDRDIVWAYVYWPWRWWIR